MHPELAPGRRRARILADVIAATAHSASESADEIAAAGVKVRAPLLAITRISATSTGVPFEFSHDLFPPTGPALNSEPGPTTSRSSGAGPGDPVADLRSPVTPAESGTTLLAAHGNGFTAMMRARCTSGVSPATRMEVLSIPATGMRGPHVLDPLDLSAPARDDLNRDRPRGSSDLAHKTRDPPEGFHDEVLSDHIARNREASQQVNGPRSLPATRVVRVRSGEACLDAR